MRILPIIAMALLLSGCGSIISRTVPGQGHGNQYYPGVQWDVRDSGWRYLTILDLPFSLVFDTLLLPLDASHGPYNCLTLVPLVGRRLSLFGVQRGLELEFTFIPLMKRIFLQPLLTELYLIIIPIEDALRGFAAKHR